MHYNRVRATWKAVLAVLAALLFCGPALAQVSPAEILNPRLKALEAKYLPQIESLHQAIVATKFPFPFVLARYVQSNPAKRDSFDSRGIEFVYFHNRVVLKISGINSVVYSAERMTQNQRAAMTFQDVVLPVLRIVAAQIPRNVECDDIGFEIVYHTRASAKTYDYEGKEIFAAVFNKNDAFAAANAAGNKQLQEILNRSPIYVDGQDFGVALGARDPLNVEALARSVPGQAAASVSATPSAQSSSGSSSNIVLVSPAKPPATPEVASAENSPGEAGIAAAAPPGAPAPPAISPSATSPKPAPTQADVERLQSQFQPQLDAFVKSSGPELHLVGYAPPSLVLYHGEIVLQLSLRDPREFDANNSSIYKRAAQSFDLFLAPKLKPMLPASDAIQALDFSVLHRLGGGTTAAEAVEYICPARALRSFAADEITSQDLINQSVVLVNGVQISLNLQAVE